MTRHFIPLLFLVLFALPTAAQRYSDASFPGGLDSMIQYVQTHINIPDNAPLTEKGIRVTVEFTVTTAGKITLVRTPSGTTASPYLDALVALVEGLPDFKPGVIRGKKAEVEYSLSGVFSVKAGEDGTPVRVFELQQPPRFPGGLAALADFLSVTIKYPREAVANRISGTVKVSFDVDSSGVPVNIAIRGDKLGFGLDEESMRVAGKMPGWVPGIQYNKKVKVNFVLPIRFTTQPRRF